MCRAEEHGVGIRTKNECRSCKAGDDARMPFYCLPWRSLASVGTPGPLLCRVRCPTGILRLAELPDAQFAKNP
jgi:hypothetical protein